MHQEMEFDVLMTNTTQAIEQVKQEYSKPDSTIEENELEMVVEILEETEVSEGSDNVVNSLFSKVNPSQVAFGFLLFVIWPILAAGVVSLHAIGIVDMDEYMEDVFATVGVWFIAAFFVGMTGFIFAMFMGV